MVIVTTFVEPESSIRLLQRNVRAVLDKKPLGTGTLYVSERNLCWQEKDNVGFQIDYHSISLHAISKDANVYPEECIYVLIDAHIQLPGYESPRTEAEDDSDEESEPAVSELVFIPEDPGLIQSIYDAIKVCQELNPDPQDVEDEDDHLYEDAEEDMDVYHDIEGDNYDPSSNEDVEELRNRLENHFVTSQLQHRNGVSNGAGDHEDEDEFEDAD